jgi:hypothetical protein
VRLRGRTSPSQAAAEIDRHAATGGLKEAVGDLGVSMAAGSPGGGARPLGARHPS